MTENAKTKTTGGAVIIDDGGIITTPPAKRTRRLGPGPLRMDTTVFDADGLLGPLFPRHELTGLSTMKVVVHYRGAEIPYRWSEVRSFKVHASGKNISGDLGPGALVLHASPRLRKGIAGNVYFASNSGPITRLHLDLANGSEVNIHESAGLELFFTRR